MTSAPTTSMPTTQIPTMNPTHIPLSCPVGSTQIGSTTLGNGIIGCGTIVPNCDARYDKNTVQDCYNYCVSYPECAALSFAPIGGDQDH